MLRRLWNIRFAILGVTGAAVCLLLLGPGLVWTWRGATDFMDLYAGAKLSFTGHQYNTAAVLATQAQWTGFQSATRLFMRLPAFGLLLWPLAQLPYREASAIWEALCAAAIIGFALLWPANRRHVAIACCWSLPAWMTLAEGQDTAFLLLWLALAVIALRKGRWVAAGLLLSVCAAKFHLFLLLPLWLIAHRLWRVGWGLAAGGLVLLTASFVAGGRSWPQQYFDLLREPSANPYTGIMPNLHSLFAGLPHGALGELTVAAAVAILAWLGMRKLDAVAALAPALIAGLIIAPHDYMADCVVLIPALLLLFAARSSPAKGLCVFLLTPVPYACLMLHCTWMVVAPAIAILTISSGLIGCLRDRLRLATRPQSARCLTAAEHSPL